MMDDLKLEMIDEARVKAMEKYNTTDISPIGERESFDECFTIDEDTLIFWFEIDIECGRTSCIVMRDLPA